MSSIVQNYPFLIVELEVKMYKFQKEKARPFSQERVWELYQQYI